MSQPIADQKSSLNQEEPLVLEHESERDDGPGRFRNTTTLDEQSNGESVVTLRGAYLSGM